MDASARFSCHCPDCTVQRSEGGKAAYASPEILWEQEFVAFAQLSQPICIPGSDPRCTP
jgi:hypothetical protein